MAVENGVVTTVSFTIFHLPCIGKACGHYLDTIEMLLMLSSLKKEMPGVRIEFEDPLEDPKAGGIDIGSNLEVGCRRAGKSKSVENISPVEGNINSQENETVREVNTGRRKTRSVFGVCEERNMERFRPVEKGVRDRFVNTVLGGFMERKLFVIFEGWFWQEAESRIDVTYQGKIGMAVDFAKAGLVRNPLF
ncbi:hypothetical protein GOBAR_AA18346 [Gossypium barbadense]|uniref:Uncharacterized protein n=1 Tax=Gossypium barbadense TaxID=3634 RepID=A0A2P5XGB0_GOSBA|nr:hypothetical protein GOBAR_AA18346 [Gossypium barbadense]